MVGVDITTVALEWAEKNREANSWLADLLTVRPSAVASDDGGKPAGVQSWSAVLLLGGCAGLT